MQKQIITVVSLLVLTACSNRTSTVFDFFSRKDTPADVAYVADEAGETNSQISGAGYHLVKRADRYAAADYIILPQEYAVVATRAVNKMLADVPAIFAADKDAPLYIEDTNVIDRYLPQGREMAGKTAKEILINSQMFNVSDDKTSAVYILKSSLNNTNTPEVPVLIYRLELYDKDGNLQGSWWDTLRQVQNDDGSWW